MSKLSQEGLLCSAGGSQRERGILVHPGAECSWAGHGEMETVQRGER